MKLISLNVEGSKHLERWLPALVREQPDVVCLQEVFACDLPTTKRESGLDHDHFFPMGIRPERNEISGVVILSRSPLLGIGNIIYAGRGDGTTVLDVSSAERQVETCRYGAAWVDVEVGNQLFRVATTHFPWTPLGAPRPFQIEAAMQLIEAVAGMALVMTGDFNAPRGEEVFSMFAKSWRDCIPPHITTSIDPHLHRNGALQLMVDGLFCTGHCQVTEVSLMSGLSDHQGIKAELGICDQ